MSETGRRRKEGFLSYIDELNGLNKSLSIKLVMNLDCNLNCTYCFEGKRKGRHFMTRKTADDFIGFVKRTLRRKKDTKKLSSPITEASRF